MEVGRLVRNDLLFNGISISTIHIARYGYETVVFDADGGTIGVAERAVDYDEIMKIHDEMVKKYDR